MHKNIAQLKPQEQHILNPDATLYVVNHGDEDNFGAGLTKLGVNQSQRVSINFHATRIRIDLAICPADQRTQYTADHMLHHQHVKLWPKYTGNEFLGPRNEKDLGEMLGLIEEVKAKRSIHWVPKNGPTTIYGLCNHELLDKPHNVLDRFKEEMRRDAGAIPDIKDAHRIAFFCHGIVGNMLAEVLFPQWAPELEMMELGPCDILRLSAAGCQHFPLLY